jgi:hypothetical protein
MRTHRLLCAGLMALGLSLAPIVTTAAQVHAQLTDGEGGDGGDVSGGDGGAGLAGLLPVGSQNNALPGESDCFADEGCAFLDDEELVDLDTAEDGDFLDAEAFIDD